MNEYFIDMKKVAKLLDKVNVALSKNIVIYYILKKIPKEYEVVKTMILAKKNY